MRPTTGCSLAPAQGLYDIGLDIRRVAITAPGAIDKNVGQDIEVAEAVMAGDAAMVVAA